MGCHSKQRDPERLSVRGGEPKNLQLFFGELQTHHTRNLRTLHLLPEMFHFVDGSALTATTTAAATRNPRTVFCLSVLACSNAKAASTAQVMR